MCTNKHLFAIIGRLNISFAKTETYLHQLHYLNDSQIYLKTEIIYNNSPIY